MTIAIHESALIRHFNTRKETLRAWEEKIGARFSPFRGYKMPDSRLYCEHPDFLDSIVDLIITNERHIFLRGPVGSGKSTLMLLALRDLPTLADRRGNKFVTGYVGMTGLYEKQMSAAIGDSLRVKYRRSWESSQIIEAIAQESLRRYIEEKSRTAIFIEDVADNQDAIYGGSYIVADGGGCNDWTFSYCRFNRPGRTAFLTWGQVAGWVVEYSHFRYTTLDSTKSGQPEHGELWSHNASANPGTMIDCIQV